MKKRRRIQKSRSRRKQIRGKREKKPFFKFKFHKEKTREQIEKRKNIISWIFQITIVIGIAAVVVFYFGQRVSNQGESMNPALNNADVVLTDRFVYNLSQPKRGDIIVFKPNGNDNAGYRIKRIVGLPGETVQIQDGAVYVNGEKLKEDYQTSAIEDAGIAEEEITLAGNEYFVLGDNRIATDDSRQADIGNVKRDEIYGKAWFTVKSKDGSRGFLK